MICITTSHPSSVLTMTPGGGAGGSNAILVDPRSGSMGSSLRVTSDMAGRVPVGATSLSLFPKHVTSSSSGTDKNHGRTRLAMAYGVSSSGGARSQQQNKDDSYAMLLSIRTSSLSLPPILHWKGRLPEGNLSTSGLLVSKCGHYIVGGGNSGTLYVWSALGGTDGSRLIRTTKAHYRAIQVMEWSLCGKFLITGGADGMVHVFSLMDLVAYGNSSNNSNTKGVHPIRTWPNHNLPVHGIVALPSERIATAGEDGQVLLLEVSSETVLATIQLPHAIRSLTATNTIGGAGGTILLAGSAEGTIYMINMDEYSIHVMSQQGVNVVTPDKDGSTQESSSTRKMEDHVFGRQSQQQNNQSKSDSTDVYRTELNGHDRAVTALHAMLHTTTTPSTAADDGPTWLLCSGDESGQVRIWDLESKMCLHTIRPWGSTDNDNASGSSSAKQSQKKQQSQQQQHPITGIHTVVLGHDVVQDEGESAFSSGGKGSSGGSKNQNNLISLITPLHKYVEAPGAKTVVPFLSPFHSSKTGTSSFWDVANDPHRNELVRRRLRRRFHDNDDETSAKRARPSSDTAASADKSGIDVDAKEQIQSLEQELAQARETIKRWETVNNKLMARLQGNK